MLEPPTAIDKEEEQEKQEILEVETEELLELELSWSKKIITLVMGILSYILFLFLFFPYTPFIRFIIYKNLKEYKVDFMDLDIGLGNKIPVQLTDFYVSNEKDVFISGDLLQFKINLWKFINKEIESDFNLNLALIKFKEYEFRLKNLSLKSNLKNSFDVPLSNWTGDLELNLKELVFSELWGPLKTLSLTEDQRDIKNAQISIKINKGKININKFVLNHALFNVQISGNGQFADTLDNSLIDAKICFQPNPSLEELNPMIYTLYITSGGSIGGQLCVKMDGNLSNLNFKTDNKL